MPDLPLSVPVFTTLADDVDDVLAAHQNTPNDEIEALATMVGVLGVAQSKSVDLLEGIRNLFPSMRISYVDTLTVQVSAGISFPTNAAATQRVIRKNTGTTNVTGANLDSGGPTLAADTTYYLYASGDGVATTATFKLSTNATTPSGLTIFQKLGGFATNASGFVIENTIWSEAGMRVIQIKPSITAAYTTSTSTIPTDDTIPQSTEGVEIITSDFVPRSATSKILIVVFGSGKANSGGIIAAIFKDAGADALAAGHMGGQTADGIWGNAFFYVESSASTAKRTYKLRMGSTTGVAFGVNGNSATRLLGGVSISGIIVIEFEG